MMLDREVPNAPLAAAQDVVFEWFSVENPYFEVRHLIGGLRRKMRLTPKAIEDDVRSAKARGLVPKDWPARTPLPAEAASKLEAARADARAEAPEIEGPNMSPLQLDVGRRT